MSEQFGLFTVFRTHEWVARDCEVKACIEGLLFTPKGTYRCSECKRNNFMAIPPFKGYQAKYTEWEMKQRREDRQKVVSDPEYRQRLQKEMISAILKIWTKGKKAEKEFISDSEVPF